MLASVLTLRKAPAELRAAPNDADLVGSFAPTNSPRPRLRSLLSLTDSSPSSTFGSASHPTSPHPHFAPLPVSPLSPLAPFAYATIRRPRHNSDAPRSRARRALSPAHRAVGADDDDPPRSPGLPSICRTPSSFSGSDDYFPTAPSSAGPATPVLPTAPALPASGRKAPAPAAAVAEGALPSLHPVLESLERGSMFRVKTACATCGQRGSNFPCCPKCGEMWCSRACRLRKGDGKRHVCAKKTQ